VVFPGLSFSTAISPPPVDAHSNLVIVPPLGSAPCSDAVVQVAPDFDGLEVDELDSLELALALVELDELDEPDEHPATAATAVPATASTTADLPRF
jgi:hypothetical protein